MHELCSNIDWPRQQLLGFISTSTSWTAYNCDSFHGSFFGLWKLRTTKPTHSCLHRWKNVGWEPWRQWMATTGSKCNYNLWRPNASGNVSLEASCWPILVKLFFKYSCYLAGDSRVNQNPDLTVLHIVLLREHNRLADTLQSINPQWDDETVFQEARRINIAQYQHISYYEWLPIFLGRENMLKNRLIYQTTKGSFVNDYNPNIDPSVLNSHATAAFRYFHSQIEGRLE